jgi:uncharacterized membrane protein
MTSTAAALLAITALLVVIIGHRALDRTGLTDKQALFVIALIWVGSYFNLPLGRVSVNIGGFIIPTVLVIYLLVKASSNQERVRGIMAIVISALVVFGISTVFDFGPEYPSFTFIDPMYLFGALAGVIAYILGRSRRAAFIGGLGSILLVESGSIVYQQVTEGGPANLGTAGFFTGALIAGLVAIILAEVIGETREMLQGGPQKGDNYPTGLKKGNAPADIEEANVANEANAIKATHAFRYNQPVLVLEISEDGSVLVFLEENAL